MEREPLITGDGSSTLMLTGTIITYHSMHGAVQESRHVYIDAGLSHYMDKCKAKNISIFEMGFGTGLNALLTLLWAEGSGVAVNYHTVELHPLTAYEISCLNYGKYLTVPAVFEKLHTIPWDTATLVTKVFTLQKINMSLLAFTPAQQYDIIYFDAFAPAVQPELWTIEVFGKMNDTLNTGGMLVTYCSKGDVRRAMIKAGFKVEKLPGPPGKKEILRAVKL